MEISFRGKVEKCQDRNRFLNNASTLLFLLVHFVLFIKVDVSLIKQSQISMRECNSFIEDHDKKD